MTVANRNWGYKNDNKRQAASTNKRIEKMSVHPISKHKKEGRDFFLKKKEDQKSISTSTSNST